MKKVRRVYQTGTFREVADVWTTDRYIPRGPRKKGMARKSQMDANLKAAKRAATRILNGNFCYENRDLLGTWSFDPEHLPGEREEAWKLFSRRYLPGLRKAAREQGKELKFFAVVSDMDGATGETVRVHIHAVLSGVTAEQVRDGWTLGTVDIRTIRREKSHGRLADYLLRQCRCAPDEKKWHTSRNLERTLLIRETEIQGSPKYRLPRGAEIIAQGEYAPEEGKLLYLQIRMPERGTKDKAEEKKRE